MTIRLLALSLVAAAAVSASSQESADDFRAILGPPASVAVAPNLVESHAYGIASKLRCPVCQGVAISDSPSGMAAKMRSQVRDLVAQGYSEEQVFSYFERSYGEFVRLDPPARGVNWLVWLLPIGVLVGGACFVAMRARTPQIVVPVAGPQGSEIDDETRAYLERVRRDSGV